MRNMFFTVLMFIFVLFFLVGGGPAFAAHSPPACDLQIGEVEYTLDKGFNKGGGSRMLIDQYVGITQEEDDRGFLVGVLSSDPDYLAKMKPGLYSFLDALQVDMIRAGPAKDDSRFLLTTKVAIYTAYKDHTNPTGGNRAVWVTNIGNDDEIA